MREIWTANLAGKMHLYNISRQDIADKLGVTKAYVGQVLNGTRNPKGAQEKFEKAVEDIISKK